MEVPVSATTLDPPCFVYSPENAEVLLIPVRFEYMKAHPERIPRREKGHKMLLVNVYRRTTCDQILGLFEYEFLATSWR